MYITNYKKEKLNNFTFFNYRGGGIFTIEQLFVFIYPLFLTHRLPIQNVFATNTNSIAYRYKTYRYKISSRTTKHNTRSTTLS